VARVEESHKGHEIVIEEPEGGGDRRALEEEAQEEPRLSIDGRPIKVFQHPDGTYSSASIYYDKYDSLLELARASIDTFLPEG
jgi:Tyrosinase co-factor MelC1